MDYGYTLHTIHRGKNVVLEPGAVHPFSVTELKELVRLNAVREPTPQEMQLYLMANPAAAKEPSAPMIADGAITAEVLDVTNLTAVTANLANTAVEPVAATEVAKQTASKTSKKSTKSADSDESLV